jgi:hypothetical protein
MEFQVIVDRIEGDEIEFAVLEFPNQEFHDFPLNWLPEGVKEGDELTIKIKSGREGKND